MRRTPALVLAGTLATSALAASISVAAHGGLLGFGGGGGGDHPALAGVSLPSTTTSLPPEVITQYVDVPVELPSNADVQAASAQAAPSEVGSAVPDDPGSTSTTAPAEPAAAPTTSYAEHESETSDDHSSTTETTSSECTASAGHDC